MQERRSSIRSRSFLGARIIFNNRNASVDCLIRNTSRTGARVVMSGAVPVPDEFELLIPKQARSLRVQIVWRRADELGIRFLEQSEPLPPPTYALQLRKLADEKDALKARVAELSTVG